MTEHFNIQTLIGKATAYDKKEMLERKNPRSWLKSVSAFANGSGGVLVFGITDADRIVGQPSPGRFLQSPWADGRSWQWYAQNNRGSFSEMLHAGVSPTVDDFHVVDIQR